jgi:hypothetical protein
MEYTSCKDIVNKLLSSKSNEPRWWGDCVSFDYEDMRTSKNNVSWIPIKFNLDGKFKEYNRIKIVGERVYGDVKPLDERKSKDKVPIQIAKYRSDEDLSDFYLFMELMNEILTEEMKNKDMTIYPMIQDMVGLGTASAQRIANPFCRLNMKFDIRSSASYGSSPKIFDKSSAKEKMKLMLVDNKLPNQDNIHTLFPSKTLIYGYFELSGVIISPMGISCSAIARELAIEIPALSFPGQSQHIENLRNVCLEN